MDTTDKVKILIIGDSGVGKSCLVNLICNNDFKSNPTWTIGCSLEIKLHEFNEGTPNQRTYCIELWDIGGNKTHAIARHIFFHNYHAIILVHDLTNSKSKLNLKKWLAEVMYAGTNDGHPNSQLKSSLFELNDYDAEMFIDKNIPKLIVGTKFDLVDHNSLAKSKQYQLADELGADEIFVDCFSTKSFSPGSTNSVTLSRFFDKVISKKIKPSTSGVLGFFERNNRQQHANYTSSSSGLNSNYSNYAASNVSYKPVVPSANQSQSHLSYNKKKSFHLD